MEKISQYHIGVAAEAFAAGLLAQAEYDVSVQYGANQPNYDLVAVRNDRSLKVSVKGSQDGAWGMSQSYLKNADYKAAAKIWLARQKQDIVFILVQFKEIKLGQCPRVYIATPLEIAEQLKSNCKGRGDTIIHEYHIWAKNAFGYGTIDKIPEGWKLSSERLNDIFKANGT